MRECNREFRYWGREHQQLPPDGEGWRTWLILGGRGAGKTRAGAEWVRARAMGLWPSTGPRAERIAIIAPTFDEARLVMIEGKSGLLAVHAPDERPVYEPSKRQLTWANGTIAQIFSAEEPESLRGPQFDLAWCDGYGHTSAAGPPAVAGGMTITRTDAEEILRRDVDAFARDVATSLNTKLNYRQFSALVSFAYNVGIANFRKSSVVACVNGGDLASVPRRLALWNKAKGRVLPGLVNRRAAEGEMFASVSVAQPTFWRRLISKFWLRFSFRHSGESWNPASLKLDPSFRWGDGEEGTPPVGIGHFKSRGVECSLATRPIF